MLKYVIFLFQFLQSVALFAQQPFKEVPYIYNPDRLYISESFEFKPIFTVKDTVQTIDGKLASAKSSHDMILTWEEDTLLKIAVSHECNDSSKLIGDGGGISILTYNKKTLQRIGYPQAIDFNTVGGTYNNCSGTFNKQTNTLLTAEEGTPENNKILYNKGAGYQDTSDFNTIKRHQHTGWMVETNQTHALHKLYAMGRFSHESALIMEDQKTVYLTDDYTPSVFFKFVATNKNEFTKGNLYAYKQSKDGKKGSWMLLPNAMDSLIDIRNVALRMGATYFARMEWMTAHNGEIYITETGMDEYVMDKKTAFNGILAKHLNKYVHNNRLVYPNGSILKFNPKHHSMCVYLSGGKAQKDSMKHFANPDAIAVVEFNNKKYLAVCEDLIGLDTIRTLMPKGEKATAYINEVYWLDLSIKKPTVDDLIRFALVPLGAEGTGINGINGYYFLNVQHPNKSNPVPFNKSTTVWIQKKKKWDQNLF